MRPDEANAAQSRVATKGKHRFIDKVHVRYVEREKRHWAALENFNRSALPSGNGSTETTTVFWRAASGPK